ncbi:MAG: spore germination protein GerW family protein [Chloroflexota bacterium]
MTESTEEKQDISNGYLDLVHDIMSRFLSTADVSSVYGMPIKQGDTLIIPTAEVVSVMGFGIGEGESNEPCQCETDEEDGEDEECSCACGNGGGYGGGGGGGGQAFSRPVAVVIATSEGVHVQPVIDVTKIALAALTTWGFMAITAMRIWNKKNEES